MATAEAIQLKAQVAAAQQFLADQRAALGEAAGACVALRKQAGARGAQLAQLRAEAARLGRECARVEAECARLRAERGGAARSDKTEGGVAAGASPPAASAKSAGGDSVLEYMRLKSACAEAERRVRDWERKLEVQAGRAAAAGRR